MGSILFLSLFAPFFSGFPQLRVYEAVRTSRPIVVDGDLSDGPWSRASWSENFQDIRGMEWPEPALRTRVKLLWDDAYLYVAAELTEPHLWATLTQRDAIIYRDDDFEVFLDPDGDGADYFEVEINALGTVLDLFLNRPYREGGKADISWNLKGLLSGVTLLGSLNDPSDEDRGWRLELAIPWNGLVPPAPHRQQAEAPVDSSSRRGSDPYGLGGERTRPEPGDEWRVNFSRVDWPLKIVPDASSGRPTYQPAARPGPDDRHPEENWVWSPQGEINMHIPQRWGVVRFVDTHGGEARE